jgi:hypothetical protein
MAINSPKPTEIPSIDYADHTLEVDTRWLLAHREQLQAQKGAMEEGADGADLSPDLSSTQINELLNRKK